jgi:hypothetical protein
MKVSSKSTRPTWTKTISGLGSPEVANLEEAASPEVTKLPVEKDDFRKRFDVDDGMLLRAIASLAEPKGSIFESIVKIIVETTDKSHFDKVTVLSNFVSSSLKLQQNK